MLLDQAAQDADGEMRFADADGPGEEQAFAGGIDGIGVDEFARGEMRRGSAIGRRREMRFVAIERVLAVALGDAGSGEAALFAVSIPGTRRRGRPIGQRRR